MKEEILALIKYRLEEADNSIKEAEVLLKEGMSLRSVMNRLYYAMFYAVLALLQEKELGTSKHYGAISLFDREFIKSGILDKELSKTVTSQVTGTTSFPDIRDHHLHDLILY